MRDLTLANRYARTLFSVCKKKNILGPVCEQTVALAQVIATNDKFSGYLKNPVIRSSEKIDFLKKTLKDLDTTLVLFIQLVAKKKRLANLGDILENFENLVLKSQGVKKAIIVSAKKLSNNQIDKITEILSKRIGLQLKVSTKIEPDLIGGFYAKLDDEIVDITIKSKLEFIEKKLLSVG